MVEQKRRLRANIWKIYTIRFLFWTYFISAVLIPFFTDWGKISFSQIMFLNAWFMLWVVILEIPTGTVADFWGRKQSIALGSVVGVIGAIVYSSYPSFYIFALGEILWAVSFTLNSGADEALIYDTLIELGEESRSKKIYGRMESFKLAGIVFGALVGSVIAKKIGLRETLLLQSIPFALSFFFALSLKEPVIHKAIKTDPYFKILKDGMQYFFKHKILIILATDMIVISGLSWLILWFYQPILRNLGVDILYFGIIFSGLALIQIIIIENFTNLEKLFGSKKALIFFSAFVTGLFYISLGLFSYLPLAIASMILVAGFGLSREPLFINYMNKYIPSDKRATVLSTTSMFRKLSVLIISPVAGLLGEWSYTKTLLIVGIIIIVFSFLSKVREEHLID